MKPDDMLRQARGTLDNITELASRLAAVQRDLGAANDSLDDECMRLAKALRVESVEGGTLGDLIDILEIRERRRRELETAVRHVIQALTDPRFPETAIEEARIELQLLLPHETTHESKDETKS